MILFGVIYAHLMSYLKKLSGFFEFIHRFVVQSTIIQLPDNEQ